MVNGDKYENLEEYISDTLENMECLWRTPDVGETYNGRVIACNGKEVECGYLSYEADEYGDLRPYLCDNGKIVMRDVNDWMPMPNVTSALKK